MKHLKLIFAFVISSMIIYSCTDDNSIPLPDNPTNLDSGRSSIGFTTDTSFGGNTTFNMFNSLSTFAYSSADSVARLVEIKATDSVNHLKREVIVLLVMPSSSNTTAGNLLFSLDTATTSALYGNITLRTYNDTMLGPVYRSVSGTVNLSRLTDRDVIGTFSGRFSDSAMNEINVTNGSFSGRF